MLRPRYIPRVSSIQQRCQGVPDPVLNLLDAADAVDRHQDLLLQLKKWAGLGVIKIESALDGR